jgi:hypothetical protein
MSVFSAFWFPHAQVVLRSSIGTSLETSGADTVNGLANALRTGTTQRFYGIQTTEGFPYGPSWVTTRDWGVDTDCSTGTTPGGTTPGPTPVVEFYVGFRSETCNCGNAALRPCVPTEHW